MTELSTNSSHTILLTKIEIIVELTWYTRKKHHVQKWLTQYSHSKRNFTKVLKKKFFSVKWEGVQE